VVLLVVGAVWIGQGIGAIHGSFMTGEPLWAAIGAVCVVVGLALEFNASRRRRDARDAQRDAPR
jgi:hypothetical protein